MVFFLFFSRPNFFLPFVSVWQLGQPEKSGLHYVGQTFATVGRQPAFLATSSQGRRGQTTRWGGAELERNEDEGWGEEAE